MRAILHDNAVKLYDLAEALGHARKINACFAHCFPGMA
jgi:hypothetical protein